MKKQRILALTLAATTAMSMFAGMSVSAADAYASYTPAALATTWSTANLNNIYTGTYEEAMADGISSSYTYLFDYAPQATQKENGSGSDVASDDKISYGDVVAAIEDALSYGQTSPATTGDYYVAATNKLNQFYGDGTNQTIAFDKENSSLAMTDTRSKVLGLFNDQLAVAKEYSAADYDDADIAFYNSTALATAIKDLDRATAVNSTLAFLASEGDRVFNSMSPVTTKEEQYNAKLEAVMALEESDYTATNYRSISRIIEDAEDLASGGKNSDYSKAITKLEEAFVVPTITPKYADLTAALNGLFVNKNSIPTQNVAENVPVYAGNTDNHQYKKDEYDEDAWNEFAGYVDSKDHDNDIVGAYQKAVAIYNKCRLSNSRKYVGQSQVDKALEELDAALLALNPNFSTSNWMVVKMEEALEKADKVNADDYRTNTTAYKKFETAKANLEKLLESGAVKNPVAEKAITDLETAITGLKGVKKAVPTATKTEFTALKKEATTLLKKTDGKTLEQVNALTKAKDADPTKDNTISAYENAIDALKTAIANYNQIQGWYQENGVWYYGQGNGKATGWLHLGSDWYWLNQTTGAMSANKWEQINGAWYYFYGSGKMVAGKWHQVNGAWYSFTNSGAMRTGWFKSPDNDNWYYLDGSGKMVANGWYKINGKDYYFYANGSMAANTTIGGYRVGADGAWIK